MITQMHRRVMGLVALIAITALVAACGSSGSSSSKSSSSSAAATSSSSSSSSSAATGTSSAPASTGATSGAVTNYLQFVGGKAGPANPKLAPVTIGFINQQGGAVSIGPLATAGAEMAVKYDNQELGGIDGHPIQLKECFIQSAEEQGTTCAQQMLADKSVDVIDEGAVAIGIQSFYSTLNGAKPVIVGVAVTPVDSAQKNSVVYFGDATHVLGPFATYAKNVLHAKSASIVYANDPGLVAGADAELAAFKADGIPTKMVGYDETNPDLIGPLTSAGATSAGVVVIQTDATGCVNMAKGLQQVGINDPKKIVANPLCLSGIVVKGLGDFPKWTYAIASSLYGDVSDPNEVAYHKVAARYTTPGDAPDPWNEVNFSTMLTTIKVLNELGYGHLTPAAILAKAKAFTGPLPLGAPALDCGKYPTAPGNCNDRAQFYTYYGKGKFVKVAPYLQPPS